MNLTKALSTVAICVFAASAALTAADAIVYSMAGSTSYHLETCPLSKTNRTQPMMLSYAVTSGLAPCTVCRPSEDPALAPLLRDMISARRTSTQGLVVLKTIAQEPLLTGGIKITLQSGLVIELPADDVDAPATAALPQRTAPSAAPQRPAAGASDVRSHCAAEWPNDFRMRAYCEDQQNDALRRLQGRRMDSGDERTIRATCASEWPGDYRMRDYCEEQQLNALRRFR
jgi:hypothetical protein